ncbi:alpha/beta hydrolase [Pedobacter sp. HMWF019]|uniref:alpha/beta fold hydrolase n=1 Tax=Pedobacter sp. HMWF019 TaxID=2056856 RepID=UPI000D3B0B0F|nr:alpha/beta hydrolase [Pedobacter sp. HMWF019]PTS99838.1 alpha/beta hydrolase [Pedobacter sp. HMWF019]
MNLSILKKYNVSVEGNVNALQTIVFANGFGTNQTAWKTVKTAFEGVYRIVLFDYAGSGKTDPAIYSAVKYNTLKSYADDMLAIFSELQLVDAILVAHSVSSMIGLLATIKSQLYLSKLIFIGASPRYLNDETNHYTGGFTPEALNNMYDAMTSSYYAWASGFSAAAMRNEDRPELGQYFANTLMDIRPDIALSVAKVIFESDVREALRKLDKPTLLLQTKEDIAVPYTVANYLNEHIKGSQLIVLDAEGHFPHISAAGKVISAIKSFI